MAPIGNVPENEVRRVIRRIKERLSGPKAPRRAADVWAATYVLLGLRYSDELAHALFEEVLGMEESATYRAIRRRERAEEARRILLLLGESKYGAADVPTRDRVEAIDDVGELEGLTTHVLAADSWAELLPAPAPRRRNSRGGTKG